MVVIAQRFTLKQKLGSGGMGVVWRAFDDVLSIDVALKLVHRKHLKTKRIVDRFLREVEIASKLDHRGIAKALAWGIDGTIPYLSLELVPGVELGKLLVEQAIQPRHFDRRQLIALIDPLCEAIAYAHRANVIHRDLKPSNILIDGPIDSPSLKVLDLGLAKFLGEAGSEATTHGRMLGSIFHIAPEQIDSSGGDQRTDIFTLGTIFFELATLRNPWAYNDEGCPAQFGVELKQAHKNNNRMEVLKRIALLDRPHASALRADLPAALDKVLLRAMAVRPRERYASVEELKRDVHAALDGSERDVSASAGEPAVTALIATATRGLEIPDTAIRPIAELAESTEEESITAPPIAIAPPLRLAPPVRARRKTLAIIGLAAAAGGSLGLIFQGAPEEIAGVEETTTYARPRVEAIEREPRAQPLPPSPEEVEPVIRESKRPEPLRRRREPAREPARERSPELVTLARALEEDPQNATLIEEVSRRITREVQHVRDPERASAIDRCAARAARTLDGRTLADCVRRLDASPAEVP